MGNVDSSENGRASLAGLEAVIRDPSIILGESPDALVIRHRLAAEGAIRQIPSSSIPSGTGSYISNQTASVPIHLVRPSDSSTMEIPHKHLQAIHPQQGETINPMPEGLGPLEKIQLREAQHEEFQINHLPSPLLDNINVVVDALAPNAQSLAEFVGNSRYFS